MKQILVGWEDDGKWHTKITVDGGRIVRIEQPKPTPSSKDNGGIIRPNAAEVQQYSKKYAGDYIAAGLSKLGVKPCSGCKKRQEALNRADRAIRKAVRGSA